MYCEEKFFLGNIIVNGVNVVKIKDSRVFIFRCYIGVVF